MLSSRIKVLHIYDPLSFTFGCTFNDDFNDGQYMEDNNKKTPNDHFCYERHLLLFFSLPLLTHSGLRVCFAPPCQKIKAL